MTWIIYDYMIWADFGIGGRDFRYLGELFVSGEHCCVLCEGSSLDLFGLGFLLVLVGHRLARDDGVVRQRVR